MSKLGDPDWKPPLEKPYITKERMSIHDPLSDAAFREWKRALPVIPMGIQIWQECASRARDIQRILRDNRDEWRESYLKEESENKRLRELLKQGISSFGEASEYALWLDEARAALEGKE